MTSSDLPPGAPVDSGDVGTRSRWPSQGQALSMIGAFLVGACICGGAGVVIGALAGKHAPGQGGRDGYHRRYDDERFRPGGELWPYPLQPLPEPTAPAAPAPPASPTPSVSPAASASPTPSTSPA